MSRDIDTKSYGMVIGLVILMMVYFLFPVAFVVPILRMQMAGLISENTVQRIAIVFYPVELLSERVPMYKRLVQAEMVWTNGILRLY